MFITKTGPMPVTKSNQNRKIIAGARVRERAEKASANLLPTLYVNIN